MTQRRNEPYLRRYGLFRFVLATVLVMLFCALGAVQIASDAFDREAAAAGTLPRQIPRSFGLLVYRFLDRVTPAPYVEATLAQEALQRGNTEAAQQYAVRLPPSPIRDEIFARIATVRHESILAREYFLAAPDPKAIDLSAQALALRDPASGYALEQLLATRLERSGTHPDDVAQTYWEMGRLANRTAWRQRPGSALQHTWLLRALNDFEAALQVSPLSERYLVETANQADLLGDRARAEQLFGRALDIDPGSADAIAGLGVVAWQRGDPAAATAYLSRARRIDPQALMVRALERDLKAASSSEVP